MKRERKIKNSMGKSRKRIVHILALCIFILGLSGTAHASFDRTAPVMKVKKQGTSVTIRWSKRSDLTGYKVYQTNAAGTVRRLLKTTRAGKFVQTGMKVGKKYYFQIRGYRKENGKNRYTAYSRVVKVKVTLDGPKSTLKKLLQVGLQPVGSTMYIWGGGWNKEDTGAGTEARTIGVSPRWKQFFEKQSSSYDYRTTRYQISNGLDCSGYIGWCIYNILNTENGNEGYVMFASEMAKNFASRGWGTYIPGSNVRDYKAGDIMSSGGHVWMVVGQCSDGSVVLLHSSPPGVQLAGTLSKGGSSYSEAVKLAEAYMKKFYPAWYSKYPNCAKDSQYLTRYSQMRWDVSGNAVMTDPDGYRNKSAEQILRDLFR